MRGSVQYISPLLQIANGSPSNLRVSPVTLRACMRVNGTSVHIHEYIYMYMSVCVGARVCFRAWSMYTLGTSEVWTHVCAVGYSHVSIK